MHLINIFLMSINKLYFVIYLNIISLSKNRLYINNC